MTAYLFCWWFSYHLCKPLQSIAISFLSNILHIDLAERLEEKCNGWMSDQASLQTSKLFRDLLNTGARLMRQNWREEVQSEQEEWWSAYPLALHYQRRLGRFSCNSLTGNAQSKIIKIRVFRCILENSDWRVRFHPKLPGSVSTEHFESWTQHICEIWSGKEDSDTGKPSSQNWSLFKKQSFLKLYFTIRFTRFSILMLVKSKNQ